MDYTHLVYSENILIFCIFGLVKNTNILCLQNFPALGSSFSIKLSFATQISDIVIHG